MSSKYCIKCGTKFVNGAHYCDVCGRARDETASETCLQCGENIKDDAIFCDSYGAKVSSDIEVVDDFVETTPDAVETSNSAVIQDESPIKYDSMDSSWTAIRQSLIINKPVKKKTSFLNIILIIVLVALIAGVCATLVMLKI